MNDSDDNWRAGKACAYLSYLSAAAIFAACKWGFDFGPLASIALAVIAIPVSGAAWLFLFAAVRRLR